MRFFTLSEIAGLFDVSVSTVKRWADTDMLATEPIPGGSMRRATAAAIRNFARHYGSAGTLKNFNGILAVGLFSKPIPDDVTLATGLVDAGRWLQESFPAVVIVSFADLHKIDMPKELRAAGFDGMVACVLNDDDATTGEVLLSNGWQMICRASDDYWGAARRLAENAEAWWKAPKEVLPC